MFGCACMYVQTYLRTHMYTSINTYRDLSILVFIRYYNYCVWPASWSSGQSFWQLIMTSRIRFPALPWGFFLEGEDSHGDHDLGSLAELRLTPLLVLHIHISPSTSSGQRNCALWASQPQKSVTLRPQPREETTKSVREMWWHWEKKKQILYVYKFCTPRQKI
jgi:hypothetical protein